MSSDEVLALLVDVELEQFFERIRDVLQITRLSHFKHVKTKDLARIGMSDPAARRLVDAVKQLIGPYESSNSFFSNLKQRMKRSGSANLFSSTNDLSKQDSNTAPPTSACLIPATDLSLIGTVLGEGHFGVVQKAIWRRSSSKKGPSNEYVAVKVLRQDFTADQQKIAELVSEVSVMHQLDHPHLVKLHGVCFGPQHMLVTELAALGCLKDHLKRSFQGDNKAIPIPRLLTFASQLADALDYLETKNFIHRDIACRNILLASEDRIKLGDFGLARILPQQTDYYVSNPARMIPFAWSAPESLKYNEFTAASDTWMFGVAVWEMFTFGTQEPWQGLRPLEVLDEVTDRKRLAKPIYCPTSIYQMLLQCWRTIPENRPTFAAIFDYLQSGFFLEVRVNTPFHDSSDSSKLKVDRGDILWVIEGQTEKRWWFGQNKRTLKFGYFLRSEVDLPRELSKEDVSKPLPGTFVHNNRSDGAAAVTCHPGVVDLLNYTQSGDSENMLILQATKLENRINKLKRRSATAISAEEVSIASTPSAPVLDYVNLPRQTEGSANFYAEDSEPLAEETTQDLINLSVSPQHQPHPPQVPVDPWALTPLEDGVESKQERTTSPSLSERAKKLFGCASPAKNKIYPAILGEVGNKPNVSPRPDCNTQTPDFLTQLSQRVAERRHVTEGRNS